MKTKTQRPKLSAEQIERKAEEVITYFDRKYLNLNILHKPMPTPLLSFAKLMEEHYNIEFSLDKDLGFSTNDYKILGQFVFQPRGIHIDNSLEGDERFSFTLGHEIGHLVLHRKVDLDMGEYNTITDTEKDFVTGKKKLISLRDWLEWQANRFSSAIIMPSSTITNALINVQQDIGIIRNPGRVFLDNNGYSRLDYDKTLTYIANIYGVTKTNVECRLKDLGIIIDHRDLSTSHISTLLKEE